jgi:2-(1,2-epoxy-1,2-dihydrophenyl)acetyl-CoA isomerase
MTAFKLNIENLVLTERHREGRVAVVKINRPEVKNALSSLALSALRAALEQLAGDADVRVVVLAGEGGTFTTGDDLAETADMDEKTFLAMIEGFQSITRTLRSLPQPVVAAVAGWAVGGGLEIAANCDIRVVGDRTRFFCPEVSFGLLMSNASSLLLPRLVGSGNARLLMFSGRRFDAVWAERVGFAQLVVPESEVVDAAIGIAGEIATANPEALRASKRLFNLADDDEVEAALTAEADGAVTAFRNPDVAAGLRAELERWLARRR